MENISITSCSSSFMVFLLIILTLSPSLVTPQAVTQQGTIERTTKQQILATIPPGTDPAATPAPTQLFITSPSGKFEGYFLRRETAPGAGGFGNDFCYVQIQQSGSGSVWESECTPVSTANACTLVFSDAGLEIFDGSRMSWDTNADGDYLETLVLLDGGDMQIRERGGDLAWRASDHPRSNQECGTLGAPGMAHAHAPFAQPIGGDRRVFGQPEADQEQGPALGGFRQPQQIGGYQQQQPLTGPFGVNGQQPLVDNTPFDSGSSREVAWCNMKSGLGLMVALMGYGLLI